MSGLVTDAHEVLDFWFGQQQNGFADDTTRKRWFAGGDAFDEAIREQLASTVSAAARGELDDWLTRPLSRLAYILV